MAEWVSRLKQVDIFVSNVVSGGNDLLQNQGTNIEWRT